MTSLYVGTIRVFCIVDQVEKISGISETSLNDILGNFLSFEKPLKEHDSGLVFIPCTETIIATTEFIHWSEGIGYHNIYRIFLKRTLLKRDLELMNDMMNKAIFTLNHVIVDFLLACVSFKQGDLDRWLSNVYFDMTIMIKKDGYAKLQQLLVSRGANLESAIQLLKEEEFLEDENWDEN